MAPLRRTFHASFLGVLPISAHAQQTKHLRRQSPAMEKKICVRVATVNCGRRCANRWQVFPRRQSPHLTCTCVEVHERELSRNSTGQCVCSGDVRCRDVRVRNLHMFVRRGAKGHSLTPNYECNQKYASVCCERLQKKEGLLSQQVSHRVQKHILEPVHK